MSDPRTDPPDPPRAEEDEDAASKGKPDRSDGDSGGDKNDLVADTPTEADTIETVDPDNAPA